MHTRRLKAFSVWKMPFSLSERAKMWYNVIHLLTKRGDKMSKKPKKTMGMSVGLLLIILMLLGAALAATFFRPDETTEVDFFPEGLQDQISLELRNNQKEDSDTVVIDGLNEKETLEKIYLVRVNNKDDIKLLFKTDVLSAADAMDEALQIKIYDETHDTVLYDGVLKNVEGKVFEKNQLVNGAKKNDTRYRITFYFNAPVGTRYSTAKTEVAFKWYVSEDDADALKMSKSGDVSIIFYSFIVMMVITAIVFIFFRHKINPEAFKSLEDFEKDQELIEEETDKEDN